MSLSKSYHLSKNDIFKTYKQAYNATIPWEDILPPDFVRWLTIFEKATNCSKTLTMSCLIPLTSSMCGPDTKITLKDSTFSSSLNSFVLSVCDPGGGKSNTFSHVVEPVLDDYKVSTGHSLHIEGYTIAGLQTHQAASKGWGLITSDEGHRILASWRNKQQKGESENAFLCKLWMGKGDTSTLSTGNRGFQKTSMSVWLAIQPDPLLQELQYFLSSDGFLDRFLFMATRPYLTPPAVNREYAVHLKEEKMQDFVKVFSEIRELHKNGVTYTLSPEATRLYEEIGATYAEYINKKYGSDGEESDDDLDDNCEGLTSSKDTFHILKLATILHILCSVITGVLHGQAAIPSQEISKQMMIAAQHLYTVLKKHKFVFLESLSGLSRKDHVTLKKVIPLLERVAKAICMSPGPAVQLRFLQKHLKAIPMDILKSECKELAQRGFGQLYEGKRKSSFFLKPHPITLAENHKILYEAACNHMSYTANFMLIRDFTPVLRHVCLQHHPHQELLMDLLTQEYVTDTEVPFTQTPHQEHVEEIVFEVDENRDPNRLCLLISKNDNTYSSELK